MVGSRSALKYKVPRTVIRSNKLGGLIPRTRSLAVPKINVADMELHIL